MTTVNEDLARIILRSLVVIAKGGTPALPGDSGTFIAGITPLEIEGLVRDCKRHLRIDVASIRREVIRARNEELVREFVAAGATNAMMHDLFGIRPKDLTRYRSELQVRPNGRHRFGPDEERLVLGQHEKTPAPQEPALLRAVWCLETARELGLPLMTVYHCINAITGSAHGHD